MSAPAHFCEVRIQGQIAGWMRSLSGHLTGVVLAVDVGTPCTVPVLLEKGISGLAKGDLVAVRGVLMSEKFPGDPHKLVYVKPQPGPGGFEVITRRRVTHG